MAAEDSKRDEDPIDGRGNLEKRLTEGMKQLYSQMASMQRYPGYTHLNNSHYVCRALEYLFCDVHSVGLIAHYL